MPRPKPKTTCHEQPNADLNGILLHVDSEGMPHWNNATNYFDAIRQYEQRKGYCMAAVREQEMIKEFKRQQELLALKINSKPVPKSDIIEIEEQYGDMLRKLRRYKGMSAEQLAKQFDLRVSDVKIILSGSKVDGKKLEKGVIP